MKRRKLFVLLTIITVAALLLAACGTPDNDGSSVSNSALNNNNLSSSDMSIADTNTSGKVLVAYFSRSGNTKAVAQTIADKTGGDLAEIKRAKDYDNLYEQGEAEIKNGVHPEITVSVDDIKSYDTVFVGYPIWWKEAPAMIATFLAQYDFSGKTLIPFCTSSSDTIDASLHIFSELCPNARIAEGLTANREEDIEPWLERLGLLKTNSVASAEGKRLKMTAGDVEVTIVLNGSKAAADLIELLPLELTLVERNSFAKGMALPSTLSADEPTTREYKIGDFGYWDAGPDLAIFYDDIYDETIVPVIPLGKAETDARLMSKTYGTVSLELINE